MEATHLVRFGHCLHVILPRPASISTNQTEVALKISDLGAHMRVGCFRFEKDTFVLLKLS